MEKIKQIFGHTPQSEPLWINKNNLCLDTRGHCNYYAIHDSDTDKIIIVEDINDIGLTEVSLTYKEN